MKHLSAKNLLLSALVLSSAVLLAVSVILSNSTSGAETSARKVSRIVERRLDRLETVALQSASKSSTKDNGLPEDMVIYRYVNDTLRSWINHFPLSNDDISDQVYVQRFTNPRVDIRSRLSDVSDTLSLMDMESKTYLVKSKSYVSQSGDRYMTIYGLEIMDSANRRSLNGVNPHLRLSDRYSISPLTGTGGVEATVRGVPIFKVMYDSLGGKDSGQATLVWIALGLFLLAAVLLSAFEPSLKNFYISCAGIIVSISAMYFWGRSSMTDLKVFSPMIYAAGPVLYSPAAILLINVLITLLCACLLLCRDTFYPRVKTKTGFLFHSLAVLLLSCGLIVYTVLGLRSISLNSNITLELFRLEELSPYTVAVYLSFFTVLLCVPLLGYLIRPAFRRLWGLKFNPFTRWNRLLYSVLVGVVITVTTGIMGFRKEQSTAELWANRLSIDRDIALELQLRSSENQIASDDMIAAMSQMDNASQPVGNYILDNYFSRLSQDYDISVFILRDRDNNQQAEFVFKESLKSGETITEGSRYLYTSSGAGRIHYTGVFLYYNEKYGLTRMLLGVEAKANREEKGYASLLGLSAPGRVVIPSRYAYAKYIDGELQFFRGNYAYPTRFSDKIRQQLGSEYLTHIKTDGYTHFVTKIIDDEYVVISRPSFNPFNYVLSAVLLALLMYIAMSCFTFGHTRREAFNRSYYRRRISVVIMVSLAATLVVMLLVSVLFVYRRNESNMRTIMADKINSVRTQLENQIRVIPAGPDGIRSQDLLAALQTVGQIGGTDITLFDPSGHLMLSTIPDRLSQRLLGSRMNEKAFAQIVQNNKRYFVGREKYGKKNYFNLYAPLMSDAGELQAIVSCPYTDETYNLEKDAALHFIAIFTVFLILLLLARLMASTVVDRMFKPLSEMGRKMNAADLDSLDHISYDRDDEVATLVTAYNRMVDDLSDSSRKLAQAERDKAWTGMARQVAHEIKNPLTPMKLQIQRLIRLKQKGDPHWEDKFDEVSKIVLDHIDILTDTANEFSVIAKLPSEELTEINLDRLIPEEISMFDNRDNIRFDYYCLKDSWIRGPKPQFTRVIVNLLTNAVQAIGEERQGHIVVSVRNSSTDGYYDIVVEDDGPGVKPENLDKLFTQNFTTKSSGSGLGLAISRSILDRCGATIEYGKSFALGGAAFTIKYPKLS